MNKIAIIICINDLPFVKGTTKNGIKNNLSYFEQFLMLYLSIKKKWFFNYDIYLFHSTPFTSINLEILKILEIKLVYLDGCDLLLRPYTYLQKIDCDFRLVLHFHRLQ